MRTQTTEVQMIVWQHVEQGLSPVGVDVLAMTPGGTEVLAFYGIDGDWWTSEMPLMTLNVVAWRPVPVEAVATA